MPPDWNPAVVLFPIATYRWNMAPPAYWGGAVVKSSSSWQAAARSARLKPPATRIRRCVIVRAPLERVAERHPEQVRMEVVQAVVHPGRRGTNEWLARPAAPVVLPDELVGEGGGESAAQFDRRSRRELVAVALGQERCHRFGWSRSPVVQIPTPERPLGVLHPLGGEAEATRAVVALEQLSAEGAGGVLGTDDVELIERVPPRVLVVPERRPASRDLVGHSERHLRRVLDRGRDRLRPEHAGRRVEQVETDPAAGCRRCCQERVDGTAGRNRRAPDSKIGRAHV